MSKIKLLSGDNKIVEVDRVVFNMSSVIREDIGETDSVGQSAKALPSKVLRLIEEFCIHHIHSTDPLNRSNVIPEWDLNFFNTIEDMEEFSHCGGYAVFYFLGAGRQLKINLLDRHAMLFFSKRRSEKEAAKRAAEQALTTAFDRLGAAAEEQA